jgi:hypothetical protein
MIQVREQRCARSSLSGGTRSKVVDSVLAVASVVRTVVLGVGVITSGSPICGEGYPHKHSVNFTSPFQEHRTEVQGFSSVRSSTQDITYPRI